MQTGTEQAKFDNILQNLGKSLSENNYCGVRALERSISDSNWSAYQHSNYFDSEEKTEKNSNYSDFSTFLMDLLQEQRRRLEEEREEIEEAKKALERRATMTPAIYDPKRREEVMGLIHTGAIFHEIKPEYEINIGTHSGTFHCDEILAIAMLRTLPEYKNAAVVRTRDIEVLKQCTIVVDVGAEYDPARNRFDHHQRGFEETMDGYSTKLSSSGLIYKHFGREVLRRIFNRKSQESSTSSTHAVPSLDDNVIDKLYKKVYEDFMEHIDGIDNGVAVSDGPINYKVESHLSARIGRLNPSWNLESNNEDMERRFSLALQVVSNEFFDYLIALVESWWPGRLLVEQAFDKRFEYHESGEIIVLERYCPWIAHLEDIEVDHNLQGLVKYVLYKDSHGGWRIHAAPVSAGSFASRLALPESWRGTRNEELDAICGVENCVFVHANGFIGGNKTFEGTLAMGVKSLEMQKEDYILNEHGKKI